MTKFNQYGGGIFVDAFKGTLGVMTGLFVYWFFVLACIVAFVMGIVLFLQAKDNACVRKEKRPVTRTRRVNGRTETITTEEEVCVEEKPISETNTENRAKYYGGIVMMIVFGIILLVVFLPYIVEGFGRSIGWYLGDRIMN